MAFRPLMHCVAALLVLLLVVCLGTASAATAEQNTLQFLKNLAAGVPDLAGQWTGDSYNGWSGVTVAGDGTVAVSLASRGLSGWLYSDAANSLDDTLITSLDLSSNPNLQGAFDDSWANLKALKTLDLSSTGLFGHIPDAWNGMTSLTTVKISNVQACGGLPNWNIATLQSIDLSNSALKGALVYSWADMANLQSVDISGNSFCGCEPTTWTTKTVLHSAVSGTAAAQSTCATANVCGTFACYAPSSTSSTSTTSTTSTPSTTTSTSTSTTLPPVDSTSSPITPSSKPNAATFGRAAVASYVVVAAAAVAALI